jgi:hypothetical protein
MDSRRVRLYCCYSSSQGQAFAAYVQQQHPEIYTKQTMLSVWARKC